MNIYDIDHQISALLEQVDPETGELMIDTDALEALQMERDTKVENLALAYKNYSAEADAIANEIKVLTARKRAAENRAENCKNYLGDVLNGEKFKTAKVSVSYTHSKAVIVDDGFIEWAQEHDDSLLKYAEPTVDKKAIGNKLKAGEVLPYARYEERVSVQVR